MGKRKSSKKPQTTKKGPAPLDTTFRCLFCQHPGTVTCKLFVGSTRPSNADLVTAMTQKFWNVAETKGPRLADWTVKIADRTSQRLSIVRTLSSAQPALDLLGADEPCASLSDLTQPIDLYTDWIDAADEANKG